MIARPPIAPALLSVALALASTAPAEELHRWVDPDGHLHISDTAPPAGAHETTAPRATAAEPASPAQSGEPASSHGGSRFTQGLLWRVEPARTQPDPQTPPSYVFGTMHSADPRVAHLSPESEQAFGSSRSFCAEANLDGTALMTVGQRMFSSDGRSLDAILGPDLFGRIAPMLAQRGLPADFLPMLRPWVVLLTLGIPTSVSSDSGTILDVDLMQRAEAAGKEVCGLETLDEQIDSVEKMPERDQIAHIRAAADEAGSLEAMYAKAIELYVRGDLAGLRGLESGNGDDAELSRRLIDQRNVRMADRIAPRARKGGVFVAIGAAHLGGEQGVLALLERRGFRVTQVEPAAAATVPEVPATDSN